MDLTTTYLGMKLRSPLVPSASPLSAEIDNVRRMEDAGAAAIVLESLWEEEFVHERIELHHHLTAGTESFAEAQSFFPEPSDLQVGPEESLEHIRACKAAVGVPIIASLNGSTVGGWTKFAKQIEAAGADALELNIYYIATDPELSGATVEDGYIEIVRAVREEVSIPVALKLGPFFSNFANMARRFDAAGANGLVLFNRFYQPDINLEELEIEPNLLLSHSHSLRLPMRWIAILYGRVEADLAASRGVHEPQDAIKLLMVGACVTHMCAALLRNGIDYLRQMESGIRQWMEEHEYESVRQMQGSMSQKHCADPSAYERAQYRRALQTYKLLV